MINLYCLNEATKHQFQVNDVCYRGDAANLLI